MSFSKPVRDVRDSYPPKPGKTGVLRRHHLLLPHPRPQRENEGGLERIWGLARFQGRKAAVQERILG